MKRTLIIIIGAIVVLLLLAVWIYVLFFAAPKDSGDTFTDLNLGDTTDTTQPLLTEDTEPVIDVSNPTERLRQLTTKPTAGYQEVGASSSPAAYYVESGTGHVYAINLTSGEETRISGLTIPNTQAAAITPDGDYVLVQSGTGASSEYIVGTINASTTNMSTGLLAEPIISFAATTNNTFLYAVQSNSAVVAKEYIPQTDTSRTLFTIPFREAIIAWGSEASAVHYVYPKATHQLEGFLYQVKNGVPYRLPVDGYGLSARGSDVGVLFGRQNDGVYQSYTYAESEVLAGAIQSPILTLPEKCTALHTTSDTIFCAAPSEIDQHNLPDRWYRGEVVLSDGLWEVDLTQGSAKYLYNVEQTGRQLDIVDPKTNLDDSHLYFINKTNQTLWLFTRTLPATTN